MFSREFGFARLWPWIERSLLRRLIFAVVMGVAAAALHWLIYPITQGRVTFIFFIPAVVLVTSIAGRTCAAVIRSKRGRPEKSRRGLWSMASGGR